MSKKVSYVKMLKEAISEWDTSKTVDVKGPMLDPILSYKGDGELPTNKDAASILERYYFDEGREQGIEEADYEIDTGKVADSKAMKHTEGPGGEEQAGTADSKTIQGAKDEKEKDIVKEEEEPEEKEEEGEKEEVKEQEEKDEKEEGEEEDVEEAAIFRHLLDIIKEQDAEPEKKEEKEDEKEEVEEQEEKEEEGEKEEDKKEEVKEDVEMENAIIEKLISEMESEGDDFYGGDFEDSMEEEGGSAEGDSPSMKHTEGPGGEEQAGTGDADTLIPDRKDIHDKVVEAPDLKEARDIIASIFEQEADEEDEEDKEEKLDVDKEVKKEQAPPPPPSAMVGGPSPNKKGEDWDLEEAFKLFREEIEEEDEPEEKEDKVKVEKIDPRRIRV
jgi:hypothetical protein